MIVYLDTSVVLRVLFGEPNPLPIWGKWNKAYSSILLRIEALRTIDRLRLFGDITDSELADLTQEIQTVFETLYIVRLTDSILQRASESFPTVVGTLDAFHLSTALAIREYEALNLLLTHDQQLGTTARSLGFEVVGI